MNFGPAMAVALVCLECLTPEAGNATVVSVLGTAGPWDSSLNPAYGFGDGHQTAASTVSVSPSQRYVVKYMSGFTTTSGVFPYDGSGSCCDFAYGYYVPGRFPVIRSTLNELLGAFIDSGGRIVSRPFTVGNGPLELVAPFGASFISLGVNDENYFDNTGSIRVAVSLPEPSSWAMLFMGFGLIGARVRSFRNGTALTGAS